MKFSKNFKIIMLLVVAAQNIVLTTTFVMGVVNMNFHLFVEVLFAIVALWALFGELVALSIVIPAYIRWFIWWIGFIRATERKICESIDTFMTNLFSKLFGEEKGGLAK